MLALTRSACPGDSGTYMYIIYISRSDIHFRVSISILSMFFIFIIASPFINHYQADEPELISTTSNMLTVGFHSSNQNKDEKQTGFDLIFTVFRSGNDSDSGKTY